MSGEPLTVLHVLVYVLESADDPFAGIRAALCATGGEARHVVREVRLTPEHYAVVRAVEFSWRRFLRVGYYGEIFRAVERGLQATATAQGDHGPVVLYLSDEGVWAEVVNAIRRRAAWGDRTLLVNVQHGFYLPVVPGTVKVRRLLNKAAGALLGYPVYGFGFGAGACDVYLVYGEREKRFVEGRGNRHVYTCPRLIKQDLLGRYARHRQAAQPPDQPRRILFALPACVLGSEMRCTLPEFLEAIAPLVRHVVRDLGFAIAMRLHPGRRNEDGRRVLRDSSVWGLVEVDEEPDLARSLARSWAVMAAHSTVLHDALVVGKVPVAVRTRCFDEPLEFPHEVIDVRAEFEDRLRQALDDGTVARYATGAERPEIDWEREVVELISRGP